MDSMLPIPHRLHNAIIGPKGKLVRMVMDECGGVRITFPPTDAKADDIKLHGPKDDVEKASRMLQELADEQVCEMREVGEVGEGVGREIREGGCYTHTHPHTHTHLPTGTVQPYAGDQVQT